MLCVPAASPLVLHAAVFELPLPASATAAQIALPPSVNATVPVGPLPVTVAVHVTLAPAVDGFSELASAVVVPVRAPDVTATLSTKVVLSSGSVPVSAMVCAPLAATANGMLTVAKSVPAGETRPPICTPSTV